MNPQTFFRSLAVVGRCGPCLAGTWIVLLGFATAATAQLSAEDFPQLGPEVGVGQGATRACLESLEGEAVCGRFRVPENRELESSRVLDLAFVLVKALDEERRSDDALTFFLGGPGSSPIASAAALSQVMRDFRTTRDLLFVDFRGVGWSGDLSCTDEYPRGLRSRFEELFPLDHVQACAARLGNLADLEQYTSEASIRDVEALRRWLGLGRFNLYSGSYGVREALIYARLFPDSLRTMILDAAKGLDQPGYLSHARGLQNALDVIVKGCAAEESCRSEYPDLASDLEKVLRIAGTTPASVQIDGQKLPVGPIVVGYALRGLLYSRGDEVPRFLTDAAAGNWQPLAEYYVQRQSWVSNSTGDAGYHFSVLCAEDIDRVQDADVKRETAGTFLGPLLIDAYRAVCAIWPHATLDASHWQPVRTKIPALVMNGEHDPVTPPSAGAQLARQLGNAIHVVFYGSGHGAFGPCPQGIERQFIELGSIEGVDTSCAVPSGQSPN